MLMIMVNETARVQTNITGLLDVHGWLHLDAVLLAALITESPLLLVGPHGTAKSLLVEKMANALNMEMRHYNASLLNYDDLVGIPLPDESGEKLHFVTTPGSIWDAEFVFFDEISRCRSDLQNKLFPIIHERKIIGIKLEKLRHRWAAMNPPAPEDIDQANQQSEFYVGSEPLDPALADRFPFVVAVPNWTNLSKEERREIILGKGDNRTGEAQGISADGELSLEELMTASAKLLPKLEEEFSDWLPDYIMTVMDVLEQSNLAQSPRRARMLARSLIAVHAARMVLEGDDTDVEYSAQIALLYGMPQNCSEVPPSPATIVATHKQAWEIASLADNDQWRQVLEENDPVQRVLIADRLDFSEEDMARLITQALGAEESDARQMGLAVVLYLSFRNRRDLVPAAWEPIIKLANRVLQPRPVKATIPPGFVTNTWKEIRGWMDKRPKDTDVLENIRQNYVLAGFPELWKSHKWQEALEQFEKDLDIFNVKEQLA
jgi:MoxR-like ATPase